MPASFPAQRRIAAIAVVGSAALLALFAALAWTAVVGKSATADESYHALAGWLHLWHSDDRFDCEHPPLWNMWAALPNGPHSLQHADSLDWSGPPLDNGGEFVFTVDTLYRTAGNDATRFLLRERAMMLAIGVALGAAIAALGWRWAIAGGARAAAAAVAALTATGLYALDPNFLAHAPLVKNDVPTAAAMLAVVACAWALGRRLSLARVVLLGVACGIAPAVKHSGIAIAATAIGLLYARALLPWPWMISKRRHLDRTTHRLVGATAATGMTIAIAVGVLWLVYGLRYRPTPAPNSAMDLQPLVQRVIERSWQSRQPGTAATPPTPTPADLRSVPLPVLAKLALFAAAHRLLPQAFVAGLLHTEQSALLWPAFLCGRFSRTGWWWYFPFVMAVKTPTATLAIAIIAVATAPRLRTGAQKIFRNSDAGSEVLRRAGYPALRSTSEPASGNRRRSEAVSDPSAAQRSSTVHPLWTTLCCLLPAAAYLAAAIGSNMNIGVRHLLPIYPLLLIAIGMAAARMWAARPRTTAVVLALAGIGLAIETLSAYPNFIPFFNTMAGGSRGGLGLLSDSNLDWGQDLPLLAAWQRANPNQKLYLAYFGTADPAYYGIRYVNLPAGYQLGPPTGRIDSPGVIAISATLLQGTYDRDRLGRSLYHWLADREEPFAVLGGSIYLFRFP